MRMKIFIKLKEMMMQAAASSAANEMHEEAEGMYIKAVVSKKY